MPNESNDHSQHGMELKFIRLVERLEGLTKNCDRIGDKVNKELVSHDKLKVVETEIRTLQRDALKVSESLTWLVRLIFATMLTSAAGLIIFLLQKG